MFGLIKTGFQTTVNSYASLFSGIKSAGFLGGLKSFAAITTAPAKLITGLFSVGTVGGTVAGGFFIVKFFKVMFKVLLVLLIIFILLKIFKRFRKKRIKKEIMAAREDLELRELRGLNNFKRRKEE